MSWRLFWLSIFFLVFPSQCVWAQEVIGFRLGLNVAGLGGDVLASDDLGNRIGFTVGLFGTVPLRGGFAIQPEILYAQKGLTAGSASIRDIDGADIGSSLPLRVELTYLDLPLLLKYSLPIGPFTRTSSLSLYAGPAISFELAERIVLDQLQGSQESDQFRSPEIGVAVGIDLESALFGLDGLVGVRYSRGVGNVLEVEVSQGRSVYNRLFSFFVGIHLR